MSQDLYHTLDSHSVDYSINVNKLSELIEKGWQDRDEGLAMIRELGGVRSIMEKLKTDEDQGLSVDEQMNNFQSRKAAFGTNMFKTKPPKSLWAFWKDALSDRILQLLIVAAIVSIILETAFGHDPSTGWIEGAAILAAVFLVSGVTAFNDWTKDRKFRQLSAVTKNRMIKVIRAGEQNQLPMNDLLTGDIVYLEQGDFIPADALFISGHSMSVDESPMTGEPVAITKDESNPFFLSGCTMMEGVGKVVVVAVGMNSQWGKLKAMLEVDEENTPLQDRLDWLAGFIGKVGFIISILTFVSLVLQWLIPSYAIQQSPWVWQDLDRLVQFAIISITIIVVAVPEGLPLAVTISLAYSMFKMMADQNLVRHLVACETMGGATQICSDKTGTLTENKMTVVRAWLAGESFDYQTGAPASAEQVSSQVLHPLVEGMCVNSSANVRKNERGSDEFIGNKTECALLVYAHKLGSNYEDVRASVRILTVLPFNSKKKRMTTIISLPDGGTRMYVKGASEVVLERSIKYIANDGERELTDDLKHKLEETINSFASNGLRTLTLAYKNLDGAPPLAKRKSVGTLKRKSIDTDATELTKRKSTTLKRQSLVMTPQDELAENALKRQSSTKRKSIVAQPLEEDDIDTELTLVGIVGIEDPIRNEVVGAVAECKLAGITVRMLTGDNILTAKTIAKRCGILTEDGIALEGPKFRTQYLTNKSKLDRILPKLQVIARCSPEDKLQLVRRLREKGEVVAVTGDGTNDAPQLMEADVGFSMGIAGTDVAKDASDIILLDDNFNSIVKAVMWGRNVFDSIRKFVQFQLTVNVAAVAVAFIGALTKGDSPLKAIQLLWVNLIMDTMAALALATERPTRELLHRPPYGRHSPLITMRMWRFILGHAAYQLIIMFTLLYAARDWAWLRLGSDTQHQTLIFNTFVFCQIFNEFNARRLGDELNMFKNIHTNYIFIGVIVITVITQALIVEFGGLATQTEGLSVNAWFLSIILGAGEIPYGLMLRFIPVKNEQFASSSLSEQTRLLNGKPNFSDTDFDEKRSQI